jgi:hypothetical protein
MKPMPLNSPFYRQLLNFLKGEGLTPKLPLAGGTMTGPLILDDDPATDLGAATKQYVDDAVAGVEGGEGGLPDGLGFFRQTYTGAQFKAAAAVGGGNDQQTKGIELVNTGKLVFLLAGYIKVLAMGTGADYGLDDRMRLSDAETMDNYQFESSIAGIASNIDITEFASFGFWLDVGTGKTVSAALPNDAQFEVGILYMETTASNA